MIHTLMALVQAAGATAAATVADTAAKAEPLTTFTARARDPMAAMFRFLFTTVPQQVQIGGVVIGGPIAAYVAWLAWKNRVAVWGWFTAKSRAWKIAFVAIVGFMGLGAAGAGAYGYHYMMHDNNFCQSCHVMDTAWDRFQGTKHKDQKCHDCHQQPLWVSSKEMYWWVLERRMAIPAHDKVPNVRCEGCHVTAKKDSVRTNVLLSAGHALHYSSDSSALKDLQCTKCHGTDFHRFVPNNNTCAQAGCHQGKKIVLGKMAVQTGMHCTMCHGFKDKSSTAAPQVAVSKLDSVAPNAAARDSAKRDLTPKQNQCESCHKMSEKMRGFVAEKDPHKAVCGTCHNPHKQEAPKATYETCATAQCHASADTLTAMHRGLKNHALDDCSACHKAHDWKVDAKNCLGCHQNVYQMAPKRMKRAASAVPATPAPHAGLPSASSVAPSTPRADAPSARHGLFQRMAYAPRRGASPRRGGLRLRQVSRQTQGAPAPAKGGAVARSALVAPPDPTDTLMFAHGRHKALKCAQCHQTDATHGQLKLKVPADCQSCHHAADARAGACATCHAPNELRNAYNKQVTLNVSARKTGPVTRNLAFRHELHGKVNCVDCHGTAVSKKVERTCNSCHADHHAPARDCAACHPTAKVGHERPIHEGCATCHTDSRAAALVASRTMCLACHAPQRNHKEGRECATCHAVALTHVGTKEGR